MVLPYVSPPQLRGIPIQPYGMLVLLALVCAVLTAVVLAHRHRIPGTDRAVLLPIAVGAAFVAAHVFDVVAYQLDRAEMDSALWRRLFDGMSLFGALLGVALTTFVVARLRRLDLALWADIVAVACLVAMTIGRVGCALVHDHPGLPTDSVFGVDFPREAVYWMRAEVGNALIIRMHDVGLEELLALIPMTAAAIVLVRRRLRAGMVAAIAAIAYACVRFGLDFLRLPSTEPRHAGLTVGQWSCIVMAAIAAIALSRIVRVGHIAPIGAELGGQVGGRRRAPLPSART